MSKLRTCALLAFFVAATLIATQAYAQISGVTITKKGDVLAGRNVPPASATTGGEGSQFDNQSDQFVGEPEGSVIIPYAPYMPPINQGQLGYVPGPTGQAPAPTGPIVMPWPPNVTPILCQNSIIDPISPSPTGSCADFLKALAQRESGGRYNITNKYGYQGAYQMGSQARADGGCGNVSKEEFLSNSALQDSCVLAYESKNMQYIKSLGLCKYIGQNVGGRTMTPAAMVAASHLGGPGHLKDYLQSGGSNVFRDANGTPITQYMDKFGGYDISSCIKNSCS